MGTMKSFELWQSKISTLSEIGVKGGVLFLAYESASESDAESAGFEFVGTTWDASGVTAKAYKFTAHDRPVHNCLTCGKFSELYPGMYCCGKKRIRRS